MVLRSRGFWAVAVCTLAACGGRSTLGLSPDMSNGGLPASGGTAALGGVAAGGTGGDGALGGTTSGGGVSGTSGPGGGGTTGGALGGTSTGGRGGRGGSSATSGAAGTVASSSDDTSLRNLSFSLGFLSPFFDPSQHEYSITFPRDTESIGVKAYPNNPDAEVEVAKQLADGPVDVEIQKANGTIPIRVTAPSGATATTYVRYVEEIVESTTYVKPSHVEEFAAFGTSVAISGDTLAVGAYAAQGTDELGRQGAKGAVYVFVKTDAGWQEQAQLTPSGPRLYQQFGYALALSKNTLVVGAPGESGAASGVNGDDAGGAVNMSGAAYVYVRDGVTWTQQAYLKAESPEVNGFFGVAVALEDDTLVVGASGQTAVLVDGSDTLLSHEGTAMVFVRDSETWSMRQTLVAATPTEDGLFGGSVALEGDTIAVGAISAPVEDPGAGTLSFAGAVTVFAKSGSVWTQQELLHAPRPTAHAYFGNAVALENDFLVVGASGETGPYSDELGAVTTGAGAAYVFRHFDPGWFNLTALLPSNGGQDHRFGARVAIHGGLVAIGAPGETGSSSGVNGDPSRGGAFLSGAVYVFADDNSGWRQTEYIKAVTSDPNDGFGSSLSFDDGQLAVGAYGEASSATGIDGDSSDDSVPNAGAAYVYEIDE